MTEKIDSLIKPLLQKEVIFAFKHKNYKKGRLFLYKLSGNYLSFTVLTEKKKETFEIPYPFSVYIKNNAVCLDYTLESLSEKDFLLLIALKSVNKIKNCKFYDNILFVKTV
jgi:hypothetical protein